MEQIQKDSKKFKEKLLLELLFYDYSIEDFSENEATRNRIVTIKNVRFSGLNFLLKQPIKFDRERVTSIRKEALFYDNAPPVLNAYLPKCFGLDPTNLVLTRQWLNNVEPLSVLFSGIDNKSSIPLLLLQKLGAGLGMFHVELSNSTIFIDEYKPLFHTHLPSILLQYDTKYESYYDWSKSIIARKCITYFKEKKEIAEVLNSVSKHWDKRVVTIIHGDIKPTNILVSSNEPYNSIFFIDWESAMLGDPAWDVAAMLFDLFIKFYIHYQENSSFYTIFNYFNLFFSSYKEVNVLSKSDDFGTYVILYTGVKLIEHYLKNLFNSQTIYAECILSWGEVFVKDSETCNKMFIHGN
ncbi:MAG: phosphotransferase [Spirosomataceae bacterium]